MGLVNSRSPNVWNQCPEHCPVTIECGSIRRLTCEEKSIYSKCTKYEWVVTEPYLCKWGRHRILVPVGFLSDGATEAPDLGISWLFHDWLFATHKFEGGECCSFKQANDLMSAILAKEGRNMYDLVFNMVVFVNPFRGLTDAWKSSGERGPEFLGDKK